MIRSIKNKCLDCNKQLQDEFYLCLVCLLKHSVDFIVCSHCGLDGFTKDSCVRCASNSCENNFNCIHCNISTQRQKGNKDSDLSCHLCKEVLLRRSLVEQKILLLKKNKDHFKSYYESDKCFAPCVNCNKSWKLSGKYLEYKTRLPVDLICLGNKCSKRQSREQELAPEFMEVYEKSDKKEACCHKCGRIWKTTGIYSVYRDKVPYDLVCLGGKCLT
jgi:hypothetical protein